MRCLLIFFSPLKRWLPFYSGALFRRSIGRSPAEAPIVIDAFHFCLLAFEIKRGVPGARAAVSQQVNVFVQNKRLISRDFSLRKQKQNIHDASFSPIIFTGTRDTDTGSIHQVVETKRVHPCTP